LRSPRYLLVLALASALAGCGTAKPQRAAYVFTASPQTAQTGFGIAQGQSFIIALPGVASGAAVGVSVRPAGLLSAPSAPARAQGSRDYTFAALHVGVATVAFSCGTCSAADRQVAVPVRVLP